MGTYNSTSLGVYLQIDIVKGERVEKYLESPRTKKNFQNRRGTVLPRFWDVFD